LIMSWSNRVRLTHRWTSIVFTLTVIANFVVRGLGRPPPDWLTYSPLPPLFLQLFTGLYLFVLPYTARQRTTQAGTFEVDAV
jgi:hypothetical protein